MVEQPTVPPLGLRDLDLARGYDTADEALHDFYVPALSRAISYDRSVGYFRASALSVAARGMSRFIAGGGTARLLIGADIREDERDALLGSMEISPELSKRLASELVPEDEIARRRLEVLAWLAKEGRLRIKVAVAVDDNGLPVSPGVEVPYFHEKIGVLRDAGGDGVAFQGSVNETAKGWIWNFESFSVYRSWDGSAEYFDLWAQKFQDRWEGKVKGFKVFPLPAAVSEKLVRLAPPEEPSHIDIEERPTKGNRRDLARFLLAAPRLVGAEALAEATSAISPFPHQKLVAERLAGYYPRSWLVADEVGLGKTVSAGLALRRLLLRGEVKRVLILAPANVVGQWQDELFEKFGLWVDRLEGNRYLGVHPDDARPVGTDNPYKFNDLLIVSSHLARRPSHRDLILSSPPYDLVIVDEAHHARRRGGDVNEYRPSRLLQLLEAMSQAHHAAATWLLTATPMQVHPIELMDLLKQIGLNGPLAQFSDFQKYHSELLKGVSDEIDWSYLARVIKDSDPGELDEIDLAVLDDIQKVTDLIARELIQRFGRSETSTADVERLSAEGRRQLIRWLRHRGPVGQLVTRHTRRTLKTYRSQGLLTEPIADRDVQSVPVPLSATEEELYEELDDLLNRLMEANGTRRGAGFVLTIYRRRLTSSWAAIRRTLHRRLAREGLALELDLLDEAEEEEVFEDSERIDDVEALPLSESDIDEIRDYLERLEKVPDSKFDALRRDIDAARGAGKNLIVFTQFADTLNDLRDRLHPIYRSQLATFSGEGGYQWTEDEGWIQVSKKALVDGVQTGRLRVLLATDAASEGLNLQAASYLISYDLPWNPMRIEQRIGRIDRIGQGDPVVTVRNYTVPGTVEEAVYSALARRIDVFSGLVGQLQPILGRTEVAFRRIFRAPRSERSQVQQEVLSGLVGAVDELQEIGVELPEEDPMPMPHPAPPPLQFEDLQLLIRDGLNLSLDRPGRPTTFEADRVSRDKTKWTSFATFGHPVLLDELTKLAGAPPSGPSSLVIENEGEMRAAFRSDRSPPEGIKSFEDVLNLGPAVSTGDAENMARQLAREAEGTRRERVAKVTRVRQAVLVRGIANRFREVVLRTVNGERTLRLRTHGEVPDPMLVWMELTGDSTAGWSQADQFRRHLKLAMADLLPRGAPGADDRSDREIIRVREESGSKLIELMKEWLVLAAPADGTTTR